MTISELRNIAIEAERQGFEIRMTADGFRIQKKSKGGAISHGFLRWEMIDGVVPLSVLFRNGMGDMDKSLIVAEKVDEVLFGLN